jgi:hypothetical protein
MTDEAKSSKANLRYDLVPPIFVKRVARRFTEGAALYGDYNYREGMASAAFVKERINHLLNHLQEFLISGPDTVDDNLAAVAWGIAMLMEFEETRPGRDSIRKAVGEIANTEFLSEITLDYPSSRF